MREQGGVVREPGLERGLGGRIAEIAEMVGEDGAAVLGQAKGGFEIGTHCQDRGGLNETGGQGKRLRR